MADLTDYIYTRDDGTQYLAAYAWPGGYPLYYVCADGEYVCPECAEENVLKGAWADTESHHVIGAEVYWEGPVMQCAHCNKDLEAAYGDPEEGQE